MIEAKNLVKHYGEIKAVQDVSFEVRKGDILGFLGPNGAGKSTTMKMLTGFLPPTSGTASIGGHDIKEEPIKAKRLIGYLPENGPLYQEMTVLEFLKFVCDLRGLKGAAQSKAMDRVVEICHLEGVRNQTIETLSKGFRQRVGMAQAVLHDPPALVLDEPTDGLDPNQKQEVRRLIAGMAEEKAIILSTHILEEVEAMCNRVIIIDKGRVVANDTPEGLLAKHPNHRAVYLAFADGDLAKQKERVRNLAVVKNVVENEGELIVHAKDGQNLVEALWSAAREYDWKVTRLERAPVRLEEVFRSYTVGKSKKKK